MKRQHRLWVIFAVMAAFLVANVSLATAQVKLTVLDPRGELYSPPTMALAARLNTWTGKKIGILNNTKPGADALQPYLEQALREAVPTIEFKTWTIPYNSYPGKDKDLRALAAWSDGVIGLIGD